jgi:predicted nucleotidyltransferase component of viral defense system
MIPAAEIRRMAGALGVDPARVDLDYTLGWMLCGLWRQPKVAEGWIFKGGTCLRKCYFPGYRFSEDLDFTLTHPITMDAARSIVDSAAQWVHQASGIDFTSRQLRAEGLPEDRGEPGHKLWVYYRGSLPMGGNPRSIQVHLSQDEQLAEPPELRPVDHPYTDAGEIGKNEVRCYSLTEVLAEKLRAMCGQRRFAIARDLYDVHELIRKGTSLHSAIRIFPAKCRVKGLVLPSDLLDTFDDRMEDFRLEWGRNLMALLPATDHIPFEDAWATCRAAIEAVAEREAGS